MTKAVLKQRDALTVDQVMALECVLAGREFPMRDRLFAGHCLLCIYGRLRMGDSQGIENEPQVLRGYLEGGAAIHKTDGLRGRARRVLSVVAPVVGVSGMAWADEFLKLRHLAGLKALPGVPFLPTPVVGGGWSRAKLTTPEATVWLCEILHKYSGTRSLGNPLVEGDGSVVDGQGNGLRESEKTHGVPREAEGQKCHDLQQGRPDRGSRDAHRDHREDQEARVSPRCPT